MVQSACSKEVTVMAEDIRALLAALKGSGVTLSELEKEVQCRNKWGKMQNQKMTGYTTVQLSIALENWLKY